MWGGWDFWIYVREGFENKWMIYNRLYADYKIAEQNY